MSIENLNDEQIKILESQKFMKKFRPSGIHPDRVSVENMDDDQIRNLEAQRNRNDFGPSGIHPDRVSVENMDDDQIRNLEAQRNRNDFGSSGIHPDRVSVENMDDDQLSVLEAQVATRKQGDIPFNEYFTKLIDSPVIVDEKEFDDAVVHSMQSNSVLQKFMSDLLDRISEKTYSFRTINRDDKEQVENRRIEIEQLINVYERYLYKLKDYGWNFDTIGMDLTSMKIPEGVQNNLWKLQKEYGVTFNIAIPADLGEDYGAAFERTGKMIPGLTLMYDDINNKEVNWHQVMIYREGELTPYQRFMERQQRR